MKKCVLKTIKKHNLLNEKDVLVIGVSGGYDSICLLDVLASLKQELNIEIKVAHVNHGVRGKMADEDEKHVELLAKKYGFDFFSKKFDMDAYAKKHKMSSEEAGREIRYAFFREILKKFGGGKIAVAHNKNDQAETLLMRFFRGTGIEGLKGMEYSNGDVIRPILDIERRDIEKYCDDRNLLIREDYTNAQTIYRRNKIRLETIPHIKENYNPSIVETLSRTANLMQMDVSYIEQEVNKAYKETLNKKSKREVYLNINNILKLHKSIQTRVIRKAIEEVKGNLKGIEYLHIENILNAIKKKSTGKKVELPGKIESSIVYDMLKINEIELKEELKPTKLCMKERTLFGEAYFEVEILENLNIQTSKDRFIKHFDYDKIKGELQVRTRKNGDKFKPLGMGGKKKLKDYFINQKIPREERDFVPLVLFGEEIAWIVGYRISDEFKVTNNTKKVLCIKYKRS